MSAYKRGIVIGAVDPREAARDKAREYIKKATRPWVVVGLQRPPMNPVLAEFDSQTMADELYNDLVENPNVEYAATYNASRDIVYEWKAPKKAEATVYTRLGANPLMVGVVSAIVGVIAGTIINRKG